MTAANDEVPPNGKTGTLFTAVAHIFCAVVGAGVLGLPNSVAWLGWIAGPACLLVFFGISMWSSHMLAQLYALDGHEFARYHHAVQYILGRKGSIAVSIFQLLNLVLTCIAYSITGALSMQSIANSLGTGFNTEWQLVLVMGAIELVLSQIPSLEEIWFVSALGTITSLAYSSIALILGIVYGGNHGGSVGGRKGTSTANKAFGVLNSLGNIAFAYGFAQVLLEIQDTLRQPPKAVRTMRKAVSVGVSMAFGFYFSSAVACYSALGNDVPGEVLDGFPDAPEWVMVLAHFCIVIHMITAWQVWAQPVYETIESNIKAYLIRREQKRAVQAPAAAAGSNSDAKGHEQPGQAQAQPHHGHHHHSHPDFHKLPAVTEEELEQGVTTQQSLEQCGSGLSSLRSRRMSVRSSGGLVVLNSAPIPDLLPPGWQPPHRVSAAPSYAKSHDGSAAEAAHIGRTGGLSRMSSFMTAMGSQAMYHLDTGAANEHVPLNADQHFFLPFWQRLLIRSTYVLLCTMVACVMPFFNAVVGLVGAVTFWPLTIGFPFTMYAKVFKTRGPVLVLMKTVGVVMFLVAVAATVASFQNIIVSWSTYKFFA